MKMKSFKKQDKRLFWHNEGETLCIEPWGENSLRVRSIRMGDSLETDNWALLVPKMSDSKILIWEEERSMPCMTKQQHKSTVECASIENGKIQAQITASGKLIFYNQHKKVLLEEYARNRKDIFSKDCSALEVEGREFRPILGGDYAVTARFEPIIGEKLYGMGQYQQPYLDIKGCTLELAQRNSQASVPFVLSNAGYGFLWNNPAIGKVIFGKNITEWQSYSTKCLDYWITAGDTPAEIEESYAAVTGTVPMMPEYGLGFWQCKLRYQTQEELLNVAREYKKRNIPLDVIVIDFFHWPKQGDWKFDSVYWPDPDAMVQELKQLGIELMVSIWPTVEKSSDNYETMNHEGYLIRTERGLQYEMDFMAPTIHFDPTNPQARDYMWNVVKKNYYNKGIKIFWLDEAEPEYSVYDFDNFRYYKGTNMQVGNIYPAMYAKTFFDGMREAGQKNIVNLLRCAWAGSQRYGALVWSGDIASTFASMRNQLAAGLNMAIAGIPWWTTDIGGFHGGDPRKKSFQELFARWFQWGAFCPVMRLHGDREPSQAQIGTTGGAACCSGAPNEIWCYGERVYEICKKYIRLREQMRPYIRTLMEQAHEKGTPIMRPLFYEFPEDVNAWAIEDSYMFGDSLLVAPILFSDIEKRSVYLPENASWREYETGKIYEGGKTVEAMATLETIPVFIREGASFSL